MPELIKGIATLAELDTYIRTKPEASDTVMSNFDHSITEGVENELLVGKVGAQHREETRRELAWLQRNDPDGVV